MDTTPRPAPKPLADLSRAQIAGRVSTLRAALDLLWSQRDADGGEIYRSVGTMKKELTILEMELFRRDNPGSGEFINEPLEVALARIVSTAQ
jgi:hypothetical protein